MQKIGLFIKKNISYLIVIICLIGFVIIAEDVFKKELLYIDFLAYKILVEKIRMPFLTNFMNFITIFGSALVLILLMILSFMTVKKKIIPLCITINLGLVYLINQGLKLVVQRPRPTGYSLISETGYAFPSGHAMISVAFYGFIIYLIGKYIKNDRLKKIAYISLITLITLICISRVYLGVHYASDVIGGVLFAMAYLIIYIKVINKLILEKGKTNEKIR